MLKNKLFYSVAFSLTLSSACGPQDIQQAVQVDSPQNTSSENLSDQNQSNSGSGTQTNTTTQISHTGSGEQNVNVGSGTQKNTTIAPSNEKNGTQVVNTNTDEGTLVSPVNVGSGEQTNVVNTGSGEQIVNTGSGNQTVIQGDQNTTNNTTTITIQPPSNAKVLLNNEDNLSEGITISWDASEGAVKYQVYSGDLLIHETTATHFNTKEASLNTVNLSSIRIVAIGNNGETMVSAETEAVASGEIQSIEFTMFNGKIFDDRNASVSDAIVTVKSLNASIPYQASSSSVGGTYTFNNAPVGVQLEIVVTKPGFASRRRVEVLKANKAGIPDANRYDFGVADESNTNYGTSYNAVSDKPEVVSVTPGRESVGISPETQFTLRFSEPMDQNSVLSAFHILAYTTETLSIDDDTTFQGLSTGPYNPPNGSPIWDQSAFSAVWSENDTVLQLTFKNGRSLPSDKAVSNIPTYQMAFVDLQGGDGGAVIKDKKGIMRSPDHFKLTDGPFETGSIFSVSPDNTKPFLQDALVLATESGSSEDMIKVTFSERMIHHTLSGKIVGGINGLSGDAPAAVSTPSNSISAQEAANNYAVSINNSEPVHWKNIGTGGGSAFFDANDPTGKTVLLKLNSPTDTIFASGDSVRVYVAPSIVDPAGNTLDTAKDEVFVLVE